MKEAIRLRMNKADENLAATQSLFDDGFYGVVVNRAYYAMYCAAQALLLTHEIHVKTHKGLFLKFSELFIKTDILPTEMAEILAVTEDMRVEADYDFESTVSEEEAVTGLQYARTFIEKTKAYLRSQNLYDN